jgi:hypothetical protein
MENFENKTSSDLFPAFLENTFARIFSLVFATTCVVVAPPLLYSVIWFEKFGSDKKRTLINKLVAMNCLNTILILTLVQLPEIVRFTYGPLPRIICCSKIF